MRNIILWERNNLDRSSSPYLQQHAGNPIWWQEWSRETLDHALAENKPLLVSVGYSTCHWCHVMAAEAFSDRETADYLNTNFISIKVDREQRPDIDQSMMHFIQALTGSGGWPLNVFLTADLRPVHALTYAPAMSAGNRVSFLGIAKAVNDYLQSNTSSIRPFEATDEEPPHAGAEKLTENLEEYYDHEYGGFGGGQKFPPHSSLLFMLCHMAVIGEVMTADTTSGDGGAAEETSEADKLRNMVTTTLDAMMMRGLNDHLQGGIYRYCVDREWTIPHFEKMLYDQAMALWSYALGYRVTGKVHYRSMAEKTVRSLGETFEHDGLFTSAFNADTDHKEGLTYLWSESELESVLEPSDFKRFCEVYEISGKGNFEGLNHLVRKNNDRIDAIEEKLLEIRRRRSQPSRDDKILSGLNALTAAAMIQAGRHLGRPDLQARAVTLIGRILETFWNGSSLGHSYYEGKLQRQSFLSDAGALLMAVTMIYETDESWGEIMGTLADYVRTFREDGKWVESRADDFQKVYASWFDHPVPSAVSLAETALTRYNLLTGGEVAPARFRRPYQSDFYNINVLLTEDLFHLYTTREPLDWQKLPVNSLQKRGVPESVCHNRMCRAL
ncbi:MAG: DUF255 domain-containing protein [Bacteroidales bacterium]|nr:DUF255 domain-containing protein [Bacteroidales bacterium]